MRSFKWVALVAFCGVTGGILIARQSGPSLSALPENGSYSLADILAGGVLPLTAKSNSLPPTYRPALLTTDASMAFDSLTFIAEMQGGQADQYRKVLSKLTCYTSGQSVTVDGVKFYVTYKANALGEGLRLNLIRCDAVKTIASFPDLSKPDGGQTTVQDPQALSRDRMKQVGLATLMYTNDYDDVFPSGESTPQVVQQLQPYAKSFQVFQSPQKGGEFHFNVHLSKQNMTKIPDPADIPVWKEDLPSASDPFAVGFVDGHAKTMSGSDHASIEDRWKNWMK